MESIRDMPEGRATDKAREELERACVRAYQVTFPDDAPRPTCLSSIIGILHYPNRTITFTRLNRSWDVRFSQPLPPSIEEALLRLLMPRMSERYLLRVDSQVGLNLVSAALIVHHDFLESKLAPPPAAELVLLGLLDRQFARASHAPAFLPKHLARALAEQERA